MPQVFIRTKYESHLSPKYWGYRASTAYTTSFQRGEPSLPSLGNARTSESLYWHNSISLSTLFWGQVSVHHSQWSPKPTSTGERDFYAWLWYNHNTLSAVLNDLTPLYVSTRTIPGTFQAMMFDKTAAFMPCVVPIRPIVQAGRGWVHSRRQLTRQEYLWMFNFQCQNLLLRSLNHKGV